MIAVAAFFWAVPVRNGFVTQEENVEKVWANVETQYQRRADLIPNLVETVKGYAKHEKETLEGVMQARAAATQVKIDPSNATPEDLAKYQAAQGQLSQALGRLLVVQEKYPELKADQQFMALQQQLESTENRISVARKDYNEAVQTYNTEIRMFPQNIVASVCGFSRKSGFVSDPGASKAPSVSFE